MDWLILSSPCSNKNVANLSVKVNRAHSDLERCLRKPRLCMARWENSTGHKGGFDICGFVIQEAFAPATTWKERPSSRMLEKATAHLDLDKIEHLHGTYKPTDFTWVYRVQTNGKYSHHH